MMLQTPAISDLHAARTSASKVAACVRGIGVAEVRPRCDLVMFTYIFSHFFNHALGNVSYSTMEVWLTNVHVTWWRSPIVNATLYAAAIVHFSLGLWALYQRRHFRYTAAEITQLVLGLSIPLLLCIHFGAVRVSTMFGHPVLNYGTVLFAYWVLRKYMVGVRLFLLAIAWTPGCIGLYFWLRLKPFFKRAWPFLFGVAVALPLLAMSGAQQGGREVTRLAADPQWLRENYRPIPPAKREVIDEITEVYFPIIYLSAIGFVFLARGVRSLNERRRGMCPVPYPTRKVRVPKGMSVLEASLRHRVPHASVCGGRARCSTCRVRVVSDRFAFARPSGREAFVLARVGVSGDPSIRLACQLRPQSDVSVIPILPLHVGADFVRNRQRINVGEERYLVSMFVDMRGSTSLSEARLPFDVMFLINRFVDATSRGISEAGGQPNQFVGDGVLALFGLKPDKANPCPQPLRPATPASRPGGRGANPVWHRDQRRRRHHRRHRFPWSHGVPRARRFGQRGGAAAGPPQDARFA